MLIPEKNIYGIVLGEGEWHSLSVESLQECCEHDAQTGNPLPPEEGVHYRCLAK